MWRRLRIAVGLVVLFAAGIGLGMLVQYKLQSGMAEATAEGAARPFVQLAKGLAGEGDLGPPAPPVDDWRYPDAAEQGRTKGGSLEVGGQTVKPAPFYVLWTTPDDYEKVVAFYGEKCGVGPTPGGGIGTKFQATADKVQTEVNFSLRDERVPTASLDSRPVRVLCLRQRCGSYDVAVFITRAQGEKHTHIILLYEPRTGGTAAQK
jgi:hypothetical protein